LKNNGCLIANFSAPFLEKQLRESLCQTVHHQNKCFQSRFLVFAAELFIVEMLPMTLLSLQDILQ